MKIFVSHSKDLDYVKELYNPIRESELNNKYEFLLPHEEKNHFDTKDVIKSSDLILAEVSLPATGQGIELGWANVLNVPILCVSKDGVEISNSLKYITDRFITYTDSTDMINKIALSLYKI